MSVLSLTQPPLRAGIDLSTAGRVDSSFSSVDRIDLDETSWIEHAHGWLTDSAELIHLLQAHADWEQRSRWMFSRMVDEPRLTAEYPDLGRAPSPLRQLADVLSAQYEHQFTRLWMNWYRNQADSTGWHADRPANKLATTVIPVLSLGATRKFLVRPKSGGKSRPFLVEDGDLIVMGGRCQRDYEHMVPKQKPTVGERLSLNFSTAEAEAFRSVT